MEIKNQIGKMKGGKRDIKGWKKKKKGDKKGVGVDKKKRFFCEL